MSQVPHVWHERMATLNVFYDKFSDARMATLVVKAWQLSYFKGRQTLFFGFVFSFLDGNFSCKKRQDWSASCHTCGTYYFVYLFIVERNIHRCMCLENNNKWHKGNCTGDLTTWSNLERMGTLVTHVDSKCLPLVSDLGGTCTLGLKQETLDRYATWHA